MYGPLIIDPIEPEPFSYDRDYVVFLSDWTDMDAARLFDRLQKFSEYDNYYQRTAVDFIRDARNEGLRETLRDDRKSVVYGEYTEIVCARTVDETTFIE